MGLGDLCVIGGRQRARSRRGRKVSGLLRQLPFYFASNRFRGGSRARLAR